MDPYKVPSAVVDPTVDPVERAAYVEPELVGPVEYVYPVGSSVDLAPVGRCLPIRILPRSIPSSSISSKGIGWFT